MYKKQVEIGFTESFDTYCSEAIVQKAVAGNLAQLIGQYVGGLPQCGVEVGCGSGFLTAELMRRYGCRNWLYNDISPAAKTYVDSIARGYGQSFHFEVGDAETLAYPDGIDLLASSSAMQWFADVPAFLKRVSGKMAADGILAISTFGVDNLYEIKVTAGSGLNYMFKNELDTLVNAHFEVVEIKEELRTLYFETAVDVLRHIKQTGVNGCFRQCWTKAKLRAFAASYEQFRCRRGLPLTYHPMYVVARKRGGALQSDI